MTLAHSGLNHLLTAATPVPGGDGSVETGTAAHRWQIRYQQLREGHEPCFASDVRNCRSLACSWRAECLQLRAEWLR